MSALAVSGRPPGEVVAAAVAGDDEAWRTLVRAFEGLVTGIARAHRLNDADAADVAQMTWMRLVEHVEQLTDPARIAGWLATTARRECLRVIRHRRRMVLCEETEPGQDAGHGAPEDSVISEERQRAVRSSLERLRRSDQLLLALLVAEPRPPYEEISRRLGIPVGSIGPTRARALARLRTDMHNRGTHVLIAD